MPEYSKYIGLDVHKDSITVAVAACGLEEPKLYGEILNTPGAIGKLVRKLSPDGEVVAFCYEAGPCGYGIYRQITDMGHECMVVAPSLIPRKPGDRVKTDRRDSKSLARQFRAGELTEVWVPDEEQEAIRDLTRAREDMKTLERESRQRLGAFLLRNGKVYSGRSKWTQTHFRWLEGIKFQRPIQQIVFQEYVDAVKYCQGRVASLGKEMEATIESWSLGPIVKGLMALRGFQLISAMTVIAELGDLSRFETPSQLMGYLGLIPSENSSGGRRRQGGITKTGNGYVRRILVESAWSYRFPARKTAHLQRKAEKTSEGVQAIAWKAQKRLCKRYRHLIARNKLHVQACTAIARELSGFIWAIAREITTERAGGRSHLANA